MHDRKLSASFSFDPATDFDVSDELMSMLTDEIAKEIDAEIIKAIIGREKEEMVGQLSDILPPYVTNNWDKNNPRFHDVDSDLAAFNDRKIM